MSGQQLFEQYNDAMERTPVETSSRPQFDSLEQEAFLHLWRTFDRLRGVEDEVFAAHDLTAQQYNALRLLRSVAPGDLPTLAIARRLISQAPDITRLLDRLERRGLIVRQRPADNRRMVRVAITKTGMALLKELDPQVGACNKRQLGHLKKGELQSLIELLRAARRPHESSDTTDDGGA